jgi:chromosomal replication initiator protein
MNRDLKDSWQHVIDAIRPHIGPDTYTRWFASIVPVSVDERTLTVRVPNNIFQLWIESNYLPILQSAIVSSFGGSRELQFLYPEDSEIGAAAPETTAEREPEPRERRAHASNGSDQDEHPNGFGGMNQRHTFDTFVVGANNQFAHAAALAVAQTPAKTYNPLFIYGGVGLGKTHLLQAIGQHVFANRKNGRVIYLTSERFTNDFIDAIQHGTLVKFRKRYRQADVLLIDDIHFLAGKERSQEEFFHTFNTLFDGHKQIVLSSDRPASEIRMLEDRLVSRFEWGLTAELQPPDIETRIAILRKKAEHLQTPIADSLFEYLAKVIRSNVRRLEGALVKVASYASLIGRTPTIEDVERLLKEILQEEARRTITIDQIQRKIAEHFDVRLADMTSKRRPANIAFPRQIAMYFARQLTGCSLNEIGYAFGGRDHGTVLHAFRTVRRKMGEQERIRQLVSYLDGLLQR